MFGQLTALSFIAPLTYFALKGKIPISAQAPLALVAAIGGTQLYVGREMVEKNVKSGRKSNRDDEPVFEGATFFLPTVHFSSGQDLESSLLFRERLLCVDS